MNITAIKRKLFIFTFGVFAYWFYYSVLHTENFNKAQDYSAVLRAVEYYESNDSGENMTNELEKIHSELSQETQNDSPIYLDARPFLNAKPYHDDIMDAQPMLFLNDVKNPCFALTNDFKNVGNINLSYALKNNLEIRCLPYAIQAGFTKSGTDDLFHKSSKHRLLSGGSKPSEVYGIQNKTKFIGNLKEPHFWDNMYCRENYTFDTYSKMYSIKPIANSYMKYASESLDINELDDYRKMLFLDGTPRTVWHGDTWDEDGMNHGLEEPKILLPHKIHHVNPNTKIIIVMRDPTTRLFSDYKFYYFGKDKSPEHFHNKILEAITWWKKCVEKYPIRTCAYGKAPPELDELGFEICMRNKTNTGLMKKYFRKVCQSKQGWALNAADRLRVSLYYIFVKDWLEIFPRENFLFIKFEDYIKNPYEYIESNVYPFLGISKLSSAEKLEINTDSDFVHNQNKKTTDIKMLSATAEILDKFYQDSNTLLAQLLNDDKFGWIK